ncbi:MAG: TolC family protein [Balneola sp.]
MNKRLILTFTYFLMLVSMASAQESSNIPNGVVTLQKAISIALENNHSITIANNNAEINSNNATIGNAGLLPSLAASSSYSGSVADAEIRFPGQATQSIDGATSNTLVGSVSVSYLLFDGFGNYYRFQSLKSLEEQAGVQARLQIEGTLLQVISLYLGVITQQQNVIISEEAIARSLDRYNRVSKRFELGNATRLDVLSAQVDLNTDSVSFIQAENQLINAKRNLLIELGAEPDVDIQVSEAIVLNNSLLLEELLDASMQNNASVVLSKLSAENAMLGLKQNRAGRFPKINLNGSYDYFRSESDAAQFEFQKSTGFSGGISLSLNLFNGFRQEIQIQNAQVQLKNNEESLFLAQKSLKRDVLNMYEDYETNLYLLIKEEVNLETAQLNFERSKQLFELGQITNTQFREAQLNISRVQQNMLRLKVQAKLSEVSLYQLSGQLINAE